MQWPNSSVWKRHGVIFLILLMASGTLYWSTLVSTVAIWIRSETYAHGFIILPISLYLAWQIKERWLNIMPQVEPLGLVLLLLANVGWLLAGFAGVLAAEQLMVLFCFLSLVLTLFGRRLFWAWAFPLGYLLFLVPFGDALVPGLRDITATVAIKGLQWTGVPVFFEGRYIDVPSGSFHVAEACSGIRYLIAGIALATLFSFLNYRSAWRRLVYVLMAMVLVVVANGIRAYGIIMLAYLSDMTLAVGVDHILYGWVFFGLVIALIFWIGTLWKEPASEVQVTDSNVPTVEYHASSKKSLGTVFVLALVLALGASTAYSRSTSNLVQDNSWVTPLPTYLGSYKKMAEGPKWEIQFEGGALKQTAQYQSQHGDSVVVSISLYPSQSQGAELINYANRVYDNDKWIRLFEQNVNDDGVSVIETGIQSLSRDRLVWHVYHVDSKKTLSGLAVKVYQAVGALQQFGQQVPSDVVAMSVLYDGDRDQARSKLKGAWTEMYPDLERFIAGVYQSH